MTFLTFWTSRALLAPIFSPTWPLGGRAGTRFTIYRFVVDDGSDDGLDSKDYDVGTNDDDDDGDDDDAGTNVGDDYVGNNIDDDDDSTNYDDDVNLERAEMLVLPAVVMLRVSGFIFLSSAMSLCKFVFLTRMCL